MPARNEINRGDCKAAHSARPVRGFSLLEVLVALVVLTVGLLGIVGLSLQSLHAGRTAMLRQHAVWLAGDVADRIRANPRARRAYAAAAPAGHCVAGPGGCQAAAMARQDMALWQRQAAARLPAGSIVVSVDESHALPLYTVTVHWSEPGAKPPPAYALSLAVAAR